MKTILCLTILILGNLTQATTLFEEQISSDGNILSKAITSNEFQFKISYVHDLILNKGVNCSQIIDYFLERAYTFNPKLNAIISFNPNAKAEALRQDQYFEANKKPIGKLHCIPTLLKDNIDMVGVPTTGGITALRNSVPLKDALVVERLKKEGAIILAKANLFELAGTLNPPDESSEMGGICHNPFDLTKTCGGSSSGTGAGIASGMAIIGFGTDTGGSVVVPSSFNNVFGLRSPHNAPKLDGIIPTFQRADTIGPMTVYLDDMVLAYSVIIADPTFYDTFKSQIIAPNSLTVTVFADLMTSYTFESGVKFESDSEVKAAFDSHIELLKRLNVNVNIIPTKEPLLANLGTLLATMFAEGCGSWCYKFELSQYFNDSSRFDFDSPYHNYDEFIENPKLLTKEAIELFQFLNVNGSGESYCAQKCQSYDFLQHNLTNLLEDTTKLGDYDAILMPTFAKLPYSKPQDQSPTDINNLIHISANSGVPAMNLPAEFSNKTGLPVGMMLIGRTKRFHRMLEIAKLVENAKTLARLPKNTPILRDLVESECGVSKTAGSIFLLKNNVTFYLGFIVFLIKKF